eukprot:861039_1
MLFVILLYFIFYYDDAFQFEAEDGTYTGTFMTRSAASNEHTVALKQGEYIEWGFSICTDDSNAITINNITLTYTNDGPSDTLYIYLDSTFIGQFSTHSLSDAGGYWNSPYDSVLEGPFDISETNSSWHTLKLVSNTSDTYGSEVDKITVSTPSASIGHCYATMRGISDLNITDLNDLFSITDHSMVDTCAEESNVLIPVIANPKYNDLVVVDLINIYATYPIYFKDNPPNQRTANFTSCDFANTSGEIITESTHTLFDNGYLVIDAVYFSNWWSGSFMRVAVSGGQNVSNAAYWRVTQKVPDSEYWRQTVVMYQDGNIRLKPHPPSCYGDWIPFGSSIIIGNTLYDDLFDDRPYAAISTVDIYPTSDYKYITATIVFENGDSMSIALDVGVDYSQINVSNITFSDTKGSLVTFRSMYVDQDNNDVDTVRVNDNSMYEIMQIPNALEGSLFEFGRQCISKHNTLSPDISFIMSGHVLTGDPTMEPTIEPSYEPSTTAPTNGTTGPTYGTTGPTHGTTGPTYGTTAPTYGTTGPTYGTTGPTYGTTGPTYGTTGPTYGTTGPTYGTTGPTYGTTGPTYGTTGPTYGTTFLSTTSSKEPTVATPLLSATTDTLSTSYSAESRLIFGLFSLEILIATCIIILCIILVIILWIVQSRKQSKHKENSEQMQANDMIDHATTKRDAIELEKCEPEEIPGHKVIATTNVTDAIPGHNVTGTTNKVGKDKHDEAKIEESGSMGTAESMYEPLDIARKHYEEWTEEDALQWILGLENGRYRQYEEKLAAVFKEDKVDGKVISRLDKSDWRTFGIVNYSDRADLDMHIKHLLDAADEGADVNEGNDVARPQEGNATTTKSTNISNI